MLSFCAKSKRCRIASRRLTGHDVAHGGCAVLEDPHLPRREAARVGARKPAAHHRIGVAQASGDKGTGRVRCVAPGRDRRPKGVRASHSGCALVRPSPPEDRLLLRERATGRGMAPATYASVLVRAHLRGLAPLPKEELTALKRSVAELGT